MRINEIRSSSRARLALLLSGCMLIGILITLGVLAAIGMLAGANRQAMVHEQGSAVMPFDLDRTTHVFKTTVLTLVAQKCQNTDHNNCDKHEDQGVFN